MGGSSTNAEHDVVGAGKQLQAVLALLDTPVVLRCVNKPPKEVNVVQEPPADAADLRE